MYYKLKDDLELRNYTNKPTVVFNKKNKSIREVNNVAFESMKLCDGTIDLSFLPIYKKLADEGYLDEMQSPCKSVSPYREYKNRYFEKAVWAITGECNFRCKHCFVEDDAHEKRKEFTLDECYYIVDQLVQCGIDSVELFGGEPLVHPNFWQIVDYLIEKNIRITEIFTNLSRMDEGFIAKLDERQLHPIIATSFDGVGHHDFIRNKKGAEKEIIEKIKLVKSHGFFVRANMSLYTENAKNIDETVALMCDLGVDSLKLRPIMETPNWKNTGFKTLSYEDYTRLTLKLLRKMYDEKLNIELIAMAIYRANPRYLDLFMNKYDTRDFCVCSSWKSGFFINYSGDVVPCVMSDFKHCLKSDNVKEKPLCDILNNPEYLKFVDLKVADIMKNEKCIDCKWNNKCTQGGCMAPSYYRTGTIKSYSTALCTFFDECYDGFMEMERKFNNRSVDQQLM